MFETEKEQKRCNLSVFKAMRTSEHASDCAAIVLHLVFLLIIPGKLEESLEM